MIIIRSFRLNELEFLVNRTTVDFAKRRNWFLIYALKSEFTWTFILHTTNRSHKSVHRRVRWMAEKHKQKKTPKEKNNDVRTMTMVKWILAAFMTKSWTSLLWRVCVLLRAYLMIGSNTKCKQQLPTTTNGNGTECGCDIIMKFSQFSIPWQKMGRMSNSVRLEEIPMR